MIDIFVLIVILVAIVMINTIFFVGLGGNVPDNEVITYLVFDGQNPDKIILPPSVEWQWSQSITLSGWKIKGIKIWFAPGCNMLVNVRMHYNKSAWLPDSFNSYSDYYTGDDSLIYIPLNRVISNNDVIDVFFQNLDTAPHTIDVKFDTEGEKEWEEKTPLDILATEGMGNMRTTREVHGDDRLDTRLIRREKEAEE